MKRLSRFLLLFTVSLMLGSGSPDRWVRADEPPPRRERIPSVADQVAELNAWYLSELRKLDDQRLAQRIGPEFYDLSKAELLEKRNQEKVRIEEEGARRKLERRGWIARPEAALGHPGPTQRERAFVLRATRNSVG